MERDVQRPHTSDVPSYVAAIVSIHLNQRQWALDLWPLFSILRAIDNVNVNVVTRIFEPGASEVITTRLLHIIRCIKTNSETGSSLS